MLKKKKKTREKNTPPPFLVVLPKELGHQPELPIKN